MLNRSAVVVRPKQPFFEWLHRADPTSGSITLNELEQDPTIYLIPECDAEDDVQKALRKLCGEIFVEQLAVSNLPRSTTACLLSQPWELSLGCSSGSLAGSAGEAPANWDSRSAS